MRFYTYTHTPDGPLSESEFDWMTDSEMNSYAEQL